MDYHCCIYCEQIYPTECELLMHVNEIHKNIVDSKPKHKENAMEYIQSTFDDGEENTQCHEYLETKNNRSSLKKVNTI